jgi:hypothetical protein
MTDDTMEDFMILRELDEAISADELDAAAEASGETLEALREEGTDIRWVSSEVLTDDDGGIVGTFCHYQAESEDAVHEHGERAGLPVTKVTHRGEPLEGE